MLHHFTIKALPPTELNPGCKINILMSSGWRSLARVMSPKFADEYCPVMAMFREVQGRAGEARSQPVIR
ncbi:hypothetical protein RRG08_018378 [Elysia crispata]|uniref:Uncharacterized protein n=1 Tax=Elysia crispata TaxID=231223 RepID=A0AAE0YLM8_9GAST|nr:hypothetical protein RRG08_018378 [Elysia crispata]